MGLVGVGAWLSATARVGAVVGCSLALANCGRAPGAVDPKLGVSASPRVVQLGEPVPKGGGHYRVGKPYTIGGRTYVPEEDTSYTAEGIASWYGEDFHGRRTANGEIYDMESLSAAHPTLPIPSYVRVTNLRNKRSVIVRVNDRGPYHQDRVIDLSARTAKLLDFRDNGIARVRVEYVGRASLTGSDDTRLAATLRHGTPAPSPDEIRLAAARATQPFANRSARLPREVPAPAGRPYELGQGETAQARVALSAQRREPVPVARPAVAATRPASGAARIAASEPPSSFDARFAPIASAPLPPVASGPVSAYAPAVRPMAVDAATSGRGLY
ncbi:MAG: septal ring lytic transglycosylase RlpA family protein [Alphaproteobacteria bacterium]|nr:septal ring lytic transglycosylase RlpA family protein [Alphaproteobacteria bacterium]